MLSIRIKCITNSQRVLCNVIITPMVYIVYGYVIYVLILCNVVLRDSMM